MGNRTIQPIISGHAKTRWQAVAFLSEGDKSQELRDVDERNPLHK
jgi:hypothetical protein